MTSARDLQSGRRKWKNGIECIKIINYKIHGGRRARNGERAKIRRQNRIKSLSLSLRVGLICKFSKIFSKVSSKGILEKKKKKKEKKSRCYFSTDRGTEERKFQIEIEKRSRKITDWTLHVIHAAMTSFNYSRKRPARFVDSSI